MIGVEQWRAVVGTFRTKRPEPVSPFVWVNVEQLKECGKHRLVVCLFIVCSALLVCGDVEVNPGPTEEFLEILSELKAQRKENEKHFHSITLTLNGLRDSVEKANEELRDIRDRLDVQRLDIDAVHETVGRVEDRIAQVEDEVEKLEQYSRRDNILLYGVTEEKEETVEVCRKRVIDCFSNVSRKSWDSKDFVRVHRLGARKSAGSAPRPIIARLQHHDDKFLLFEARDKLKKNGLGVANDLTPRQRAELRKLRDAGQRGYFKGGRLHVVDPAPTSRDGESGQHHERGADQGGRPRLQPRRRMDTTTR